METLGSFTILTFRTEVDCMCHVAASLVDLVLDSSAL